MASTSSGVNGRSLVSELEREISRIGTSGRRRQARSLWDVEINSASISPPPQAATESCRDQLSNLPFFVE
jgi:hypothetical protein